MPSKSEYESTFNEILGTDIKWSKLSKEELGQLAVILNHPEVLAKSLGLDVKISQSSTVLRREFVKGLMASLLEKVEAYDGPIISKIREKIEQNLK